MTSSAPRRFAVRAASIATFPPPTTATRLPIFTGVGVLKADSGLTAAIQAGLQELVDNGTYQQILEKYELGTYAVDSIVINGATQ